MATVPRAWVDGYADSLEMVSDEMRRRLAEALAQVDYTMPVAYVRERLVAIMQAHVYESRALAAQVASEFYDGLREYVTGERMGAVAYDGYDPVRVERRVRSAVQPLARAKDEFRWADDVAHDEEYQREMERAAARGLVRALADYQGYSIKEAAGSTVFRNGDRDGRRVRFARVPRGSESYPNGCPFCQMLASRGFVYRSELTAGGIDPDHYHSDCQCMVVPGWGPGSVEGYDPRDYDEGYQEWLDQDHSKHDERVSETQRNRYDAEGRLRSGDGNRVDEKGALTDEDRALIRSKRTAKANETRRADRSRMFFNLGVTEAEWKAMSEAEQASLLRQLKSHGVLTGGESGREARRPSHGVHRRTGGMSSEEYADFRRELAATTGLRQLRLPRSEYAMVMHELDTNLTGEDKKHALIWKPIRNHIYRIRNLGDGNYVIVGKTPID